MLYAVGTRIDLSHMNPPRDEPKKRVSYGYAKYVDGTKIRFLRMAKNLTVLDITEPPIALRVAVGA